MSKILNMSSVTVKQLFPVRTKRTVYRFDRKLLLVLPSTFLLHSLPKFCSIVQLLCLVILLLVISSAARGAAENCNSFLTFVRV